MFDSLFAPITINGMTLKNRIEAAPTSEMFEEKALGGAAIVVAGHAIVEPGKASYASATESDAFSKYEREETRRRVLRVHAGGAKASIELFHGGQLARVEGLAKGPSDAVEADGTVTRAMDEVAMQETLDWYDYAARSAVKIGFDAILLHFGHGWLPAQFLSPLYNHRTDGYGGSIQNRAKFPLRILETVRNAAPRTPIEIRISAREWVDGSIEFPDVVAFLKMAEKYVDIVQVSAGIDKNTEANVHCVTTNLEEVMPNLQLAARVKRELSVPVSVVGGVSDPELANKAIEDGLVDMVVCGRSLIADPDWPNKARDGRADDIVPCLRCSNCYHITTDHWNVGCSVNPHFHNEDFIPKEPGKADEPKRVLIVGGGPAGMKAAITAFDRGHEVTLVERGPELGGMLRYIAMEAHKVEIERLLAYYKRQIEKRGVHVLLDTVADADFVRDFAPDALGIAIGASEAIPPVSGIDNAMVLTGTQAIESIRSLGQRVVVLGGGSIGCEVALELAELGRDVTVVEMAASLAGNANSLYQEALRQKFLLHPNLHVMCQAQCLAVEDDAVVVRSAGGEELHLSCDNLVVSTGLRARQAEVEALYGIVRNTVALGDCTRPSSIMNAVFDGYTFALGV